jgi:hypothetical protein
MKWSARTGVVRLENDWPGVFIRGDDALSYVGSLKFLLSTVEVHIRKLVEEMHADYDTPGCEVMTWDHIRELADLLESCRVKNKDDNLRAM